VLDNLGIADTCGARVITSLAERTTLPEQIPTLIETDLDRFEPTVLAVAQAAFGAALIELMLLGNQLLDAIVDSLVFHLHLRDDRRTTAAQPSP
jgi:hypothetical protein